MSLNLTKFKSDLKAALLKAQKKNQKDGVDTDTALKNLADEIATEVDKYIKTATVSVTVEQGIAVSVTPSSGQGATVATGSGTGSLS
jgi:dUTPase